MAVGLATRNNASCVEILKNSFKWPQPSFEPILTRVMKRDDDVHKVSLKMDAHIVLPYDFLPFSLLLVLSLTGPTSVCRLATESFGMSDRRGQSGGRKLGLCCRSANVLN